MSRQIMAGLIAVLVVVAAIGAILYKTRNAPIRLTGQVLKVRSIGIEDEPAAAPAKVKPQAGGGVTYTPVQPESPPLEDRVIALLDVRISNPSTQQFMVKEVDVELEKADGTRLKGDLFTEPDTKRLVKYYPVLGELYNPNLEIRDRINPGESVDRMLAVQFLTTDAQLQTRKAIHIIVTESTRRKTEIIEQRQ